MLDTIFSIASGYTLLGWIALVVFPDADFLEKLVHYGVVLLLAVAYTSLAVLSYLDPSPVGFGSLEEIRALFTSDQALLAGWCHYLAFDLFVGHWISNQARQIKLPGLLRILCLLFTFLAGPFGLLLFYTTKAIHIRRNS